LRGEGYEGQEIIVSRGERLCRKGGGRKCRGTYPKMGGGAILRGVDQAFGGEGVNSSGK